jgi:hypothetical protein
MGGSGIVGFREKSDGTTEQLPFGRVKGPGGEFSSYADWLKNG